MMDEYLALLKQWCDRLLSLQIKDSNNVETNGGIWCPCCGRIHGRCGDAMYPFMVLADITGNRKYVQAAKDLFEWTENNCSHEDGSYDNEVDVPWKGITVFASIQLGDCLLSYSHLLDEETRQKWTVRYRAASEFLWEHLMELNGDVNYPITCAAAMALAYRLLGDLSFRDQASALIDFAKSRVTEDLLIFGEGKPKKIPSDKGCYPVDLAYNVEESLPALARYAELMQDEEVYRLAHKSMLAHLEFMLPDGGWDNSFGTRAYKWSYWGSRTSDGVQTAFASLGKRDPVIREAMLRNFRLLAECTADGLLTGGPMFKETREPTCVHHTFCHAKAIAAMVEAMGTEEHTPVLLPREVASGVRRFESIHVSLLAMDQWRATVSDYDVEYTPNTNPSGGALTLLYHMSLGPLIAASMNDYRRIEYVNMQTPEFTEGICMTPRLECKVDGQWYQSLLDKSAQVTARETGTSILTVVEGSLRNVEQESLGSFRMIYSLEKDRAEIRVQTGEPGCKFQLPIIASYEDAVTKNPDGSWEIQKQGGILLLSSNSSLNIRDDILCANQRIFNPVCGFLAVPFVASVKPGEELVITLQYRA